MLRAGQEDIYMDHSQRLQSTAAQLKQERLLSLIDFVPKKSGQALYCVAFSNCFQFSN